MDCGLPASSVYEVSQARKLSELLFPSPGDLPKPGTEPGILHYRQTSALQADALPTGQYGIV